MSPLNAQEVTKVDHPQSTTEQTEQGFIQEWSVIRDDPKSSNYGKIQESVRLVFKALVCCLGTVLFFEIPVYPMANGPPVTFPLVLLVLLLGGIFFTARLSFINIRMFCHAVEIIRGRFDKSEDEGEVSHFQALTSALSATVGLGNIAGVAAAIAMGGPGAVFWMWVAAFLGMSMKFASCSMAQYYRRVKLDGSILGGPMVYLEDGIKDRFPRLSSLGVVLGKLYAIFTVFAALGGGNIFQGNQTFRIISGQIDVPAEEAWVVGAIMAILVGMVIIGGIRRIGEVTGRLVPAMCAFYCFLCIAIIVCNIDRLGSTLSSILADAFNLDSGFGALIGIAILQGTRRASFSNEAGFGTAAIAHAAAKTSEPFREGIVAMIEPFIDTIVVCTMTALSILVTESHFDPVTCLPYAEGVSNEKGVELTAAAFSTLGVWAPKFLCIAVFVFAYSTMVSWCYYGERAIEYLLGERGIKPYQCAYVICVVIGPMLSFSTVIDFSDMMLFSMAFPNILGLIMLSGTISRGSRDYVRRLRSGEMKNSIS
ncbi:alanine/glycine:cation symporter family protein [Bythopirellula goksoeyrii]|uniref:alanine/glycine:cation symporter family protein n=1 Tax=Bythopirellula goksoeyrii TaxID=1400387 RepID=UPI001AEF5C18|nr:alanine/glycine:cation symporter family protein [Bythopirellula goksoeyrii]